MQMATVQIPTRAMCPPSVVGTLGAFFEPSPLTEQKLVRSDENLIRELVSILDKQLLTVLEARSFAEFDKARDEVFPKYVRGLRALADTMMNLVSESDINGLFDRSVSDIATDLEKQRGVRFGDALTDQATFTLWTMGKLRELGKKIHEAGPVPAAAVEADFALLKDYRWLSFWSQLHLDIALAAMKFRKDISGEIQDAICEGLRATVNVYSVMKEALYLREAHVEQKAVPNLPWDEEDEVLLASSMRDINAISEDRHDG
jgi:hypothetical protein